VRFRASQEFVVGGVQKPAGATFEFARGGVLRRKIEAAELPASARGLTPRAPELYAPAQPR